MDESAERAGVSVKWGGREVRNPALRALAISVALAVAVLAIAMLAFLPLVLAIVAVLLVGALALHPVLRALGRRGLVERNASGGTTVTISSEAFRRV